MVQWVAKLWGCGSKHNQQHQNLSPNRPSNAKTAIQPLWAWVFGIWASPRHMYAYILLCIYIPQPAKWPENIPHTKRVHKILHASNQWKLQGSTCSTISMQNNQKLTAGCHKKQYFLLCWSSKLLLAAAEVVITEIVTGQNVWKSAYSTHSWLKQKYTFCASHCRKITPNIQQTPLMKKSCCYCLCCWIGDPHLCVVGGGGMSCRNPLDLIRWWDESALAQLGTTTGYPLEREILLFWHQ